MKKIMWIISFISLAGTAIMVQFMPDSVPMHYDMAGNIDRWGSKYENLIFPIIILVMSLFWKLFIRYFEKKALKSTDEKESACAKSNAKVISIVGLCMAAIMKNSFVVDMAAVGTVILASAATLVYAHKVYVQEIESEGGNE